LIIPQLFAAHVFFLQTPHTLAAPEPPHVSPLVVQLPQSTCPPHPSLILPQLLAPHVFFVQTPHTLAVPEPPQDSPAPVHAPQSSCPPHPSLILPQFLPSAAQVVGVQHLPL